MTDVKYLKKNNLYEAHKHFMSLVEGYIPFEEEIEEAGEDQQDPNAMGGGDPMADPNAMGGNPNAAMGGADPMGGGDPKCYGRRP